MEIVKLSNGNIQFLQGEILKESFLPSCEVINQVQPATTITINNPANGKIYGFNYKLITALTTPIGALAIPQTKEEFYKILVTNFFFVPTGASETNPQLTEIIQKLEESNFYLEEIDTRVNTIIEKLDEAAALQPVQNFYYFQFPFFLNFLPPVSLVGNFSFTFYDIGSGVNISIVQNVNGQVIAGLNELCIYLNTLQNIYEFFVIPDLTQIENYTMGNTTIGIIKNSQSPLSYIQNSMVLNTTVGGIDPERLEGYYTPQTTEQKLNLQQFNNNKNFVQFLSGANYTTPQMPTAVQADVIGTLYVIRTLKATQNVTIVIKNLIAQSDTNDNSNLSLWLNPTFSTQPTYGTPLQNSFLQIGTITAGGPTPQTITGGTNIIFTPLLQGSLTDKLVNRKLFLKKNDVIAFVVNPTSTLLDLFGYISWLE